MSKLHEKAIQCSKDGSIVTVYECFKCNCCQQIRHGDHRLVEDRIECNIDHKKFFVTPIKLEEGNDRVNKDLL